MEPESRWRIGFIVVDDFDKIIVEVLAKRILARHFGETALRTHAVRMGSDIAWPWAYATVLMLLDEKGYHHVVIVANGHSTESFDIQGKQSKIEAMLWDHRMTKDEVSVCVAVPEILSWLLASHESEPDKIIDPKDELSGRLGVTQLLDEHVKTCANELDIELARQRSPSFKKFAELLEHMANELKRHDSAA